MGHFPTAFLLLVVCGEAVWSSQHNVLVQQALQQQERENQKNKVGVVVESDAREGSQSIGINWNRVVDLILETARQDILEHGLDSVSLPDVKEEFRNTVLLVPVKGTFTASEGSLDSLSTVQRTGDATVRREGAGFAVSCSLGLATLNLRYGRYRARVDHVGGVGGHVRGEVGRNSVRLDATLDVGDGRCEATLNRVKVVELEGLKIKVSGSGFGPLNWLITKVTNSYAKNHKSDIVAKIEEALTTQIAKAIKNFHCQQYVSLLLL